LGCRAKNKGKIEQTKYEDLEEEGVNSYWLTLNKQEVIGNLKRKT
jgi:hypothetical protein